MDIIDLSRFAFLKWWATLEFIMLLDICEVFSHTGPFTFFWYITLSCSYSSM